MTDLVFLDTETLGLDRCAPVWEFAAIRLAPDGTEAAREHFQIKHDVSFWLDDLPQQFVDDYKTRYDEDTAVWFFEAAKRISAITGGRPTIVGSHPAFDMERLTMLLQRAGHVPDWYYHPVDVPTLVQGYLAARGELPEPPWKSDIMSVAVGVDPATFARHTAMGDVEWCIAMWAAVMAEAGVN